MAAPWNASSSRLPEPGERVEFMLSGRDVPIEGSYGSAGFQSHWSNYGLVRVIGWRSLQPAALPMARATNVFAGPDDFATSHHEAFA